MRHGANSDWLPAIYAFQKRASGADSHDSLWWKGRYEMTKQMEPGGSFALAGTSIALKRMGYGAMQFAGPQVWGPPRDPDAAVAVLREAVAAGVNHIDTSD